MSLENVETVRRSLDGWNRGDVDAWLESAHPEIEWLSEVVRQLEGSERVYRGPAEMRQFWDGINLERPVAYVFEFEAGLARRVRAYLDPQQALEAVGLAA
jgi:ketosteroid isomerase-like protein